MKLKKLNWTAIFAFIVILLGIIIWTLGIFYLIKSR